MLLENSSYPEDDRVRREATALADAGHRVTVIAPASEGQARQEQVEGVTVLRYRKAPDGQGVPGYLWEYGWSMLATLALTIRALARGGFDVIHAHNPPDTFVLIALLFKPFGKRFVFDHHDLSPEMYVARFEGRAPAVLERVLLMLERLSFRAADHVISTNDSYREIALSRGGVAPERATVVRNGPDLARVRPVEPDPDLRAEAPTILGYVGRMGFQDGVDYLLRALHQLRTTFSRDDFLCVIVGEGDALPRLRDLATDLDLDRHVRFTGRVPDADLMRILSTADICVDPDPSNPFNDRSTMIKVTEYLALGKPVVAFDLPEHRVTAGDAAAYAIPNSEKDFARCLQELMDDPGRREEMGRIGRRRVEESLAWVHQAPRLLEAYRRLERS